MGPHTLNSLCSSDTSCFLFCSTPTLFCRAMMRSASETPSAWSGSICYAEVFITKFYRSTPRHPALLFTDPGASCIIHLLASRTTVQLFEQRKGCFARLLSLRTWYAIFFSFFLKKTQHHFNVKMYCFLWSSPEKWLIFKRPSFLKDRKQAPLVAHSLWGICLMDAKDQSCVNTE